MVSAKRRSKSFLFSTFCTKTASLKVLLNSYEFKLNKSAEEAIGQIEEKKYVEKYLIPSKREGKDIRAVGINFSTADDMRNIEEYQEKVWDYEKKS